MYRSQSFGLRSSASNCDGSACLSTRVSDTQSRVGSLHVSLDAREITEVVGRFHRGPGRRPASPSDLPRDVRIGHALARAFEFGMNAPMRVTTMPMASSLDRSPGVSLRSARWKGAAPWHRAAYVVKSTAGVAAGARLRWRVRRRVNSRRRELLPYMRRLRMTNRQEL